jgi:DNA-binding NarL/FixJ family response regulator
VHEAPTARAAIELAREIPPDFVIADQSDGLEGLAHLRMIVIADEVPYGAVSAIARVRLLGRPFSAEQLTEEVDQLLKGHER